MDNRIEAIRDEIKACKTGGDIRVGHLLNALDTLTNIVEEQDDMIGRIRSSLGKLLPPG